MKLRALMLALVVLFPALGWAVDKDAPRSFSLSTTRTYAPGESVKIQLYARNVPELEFRVYKVRDVEKFFAGLTDLHSFGVQPYSPPEQIDQKSFLERMHDFKAQLWWRVRRFFRDQFNDEARDNLRERQASLGKRSQVVAATQFARIPLLNESQLVVRWKLVTPPTLVSETQQLPVDNLTAGVYLIEATEGTYKAYTIAIVTNLAVVERAVNGQAQLFVANRKTGAPVDGAEVALWTGKDLQSRGKTDAGGLAVLSFAEGKLHEGVEPENLWVIARHGEESALVTPWSYGFGEAADSKARVFVYTDRPVYRPGHLVHIKAIVRSLDGDELHVPKAGFTPTLEVRDGDGKTIYSKAVTLNAHGSVALDLPLAEDAALGYYWVEFKEQGVMGSGSFYVEEYKKPEYQVTVKPAVKRILQGNQLQATIEARYFFGEPVAGAKVKYVVHTSTHYWWGGEDTDDSEEGEEGGEDNDYGWNQSEQQEQDGVLDANGKLTVSLPVNINPSHYDEDYRIEARVTDVGNREVSGHATVLATYASFHLGVEPTQYLYAEGQTPKVKVTAVDYDGKPVRTNLHLAVTFAPWGHYSNTDPGTPVMARDVATGADGTALVELSGNWPSDARGSFKIMASAETPEKRTVSEWTYVWIWKGSGEWYNQNENTQAQIVADKKSYQVGDVAHLLLVTGLKESWAVISTEGASIQSRRVIHATGTSVAFDVPITTLAQPNLIVNAMIVHDDQVMSAQKSLSVPLVERTLAVTVTASKEKFLPGERGSFDVYAADASGHPVEAELSFGEVDEALYAVRPDATPNIVNAFYPKHYVYVETSTSFEYYFHGEAGLKSPLLARNADGLYHPRMAQVKPGSDLVVPKVRKAFPDTAYWNPVVRTGADGHARVEFNFPDALTTWRTTVRAITDDGKAGGTVTRVLVRKNLIVRLAAPRFFRQGDETTLRVIAHNYLESAKEVNFALDVAGLEVIGGKAQKVVIPAKGESFVDWRVRARTTGNAVLTAKALTNEESDALEVTLPVRAFGAKQRAAGSGVIFSGAGQNQWSVSYPANSDAGTRGLAVSVSPSVAGTVFSGLDYLVSYPWGCTEQTMSSFLPDLVVAQAIDKLHVKSPIDRVQLNKMVAAGLERLNNYQHEDGGWGWWPDDESRVFMTAYVVSGLGQAREGGYTVENYKLDRARTWLLKALKQHPDMLPDLRAYVVYALASTGGVDKDSLDKVWQSRDKLSDEGLALAGLSLDAGGDARAKEVTHQLETKAKVTGDEAYWAGNYDGLMEYWGDTSAETTAFALKLLVRQNRSSGLMPKAAVWLGRHSNGGYWYSTKQTAMVIGGLTDYLLISGELANSSEVELQLNGQTLARHSFGPSDGFALPWKVVVPAAQLAAGGQLTVKKTGNGIDYWSSEGQWYSADKRLYQSGSLSLNIARDYYVLVKRQDKPADPVTFDIVPLKGPVHVGDIVAVRVGLAGSAWKYLLTEDPIPAGMEYLENSDLYKVNNRPDWWRSWWTHREFHDDRAAFFETSFAGRRDYFYLLKAVVPGKFQISPAQAGPMYQPDVMATTDPATLEVQP